MTNVYLIFSFLVVSEIQLPIRPYDCDNVYSSQIVGEVRIENCSSVFELKSNRMPKLKADKEVCSTIDGQYVWMLSRYGVIALIDTSENVIQVVIEEWTFQSLVQSFIMSDVLVKCLQMKGIPAIHASAVSKADKAYMFMGRHGAGKSTLTVRFITKGYSFLSDDISPLAENDGIKVISSYGSLKLVESRFAYSSSPYLQMTDRRIEHSGKYWVEVTRFVPRSISLGAVFVIDSDAAQFNCEPLPAREAFIMLVQNTFAGYALTPVEWTKVLKVYSALIRETTIYRVGYPREADSLDKLTSLIDNMSGKLIND